MSKPDPSASVWRNLRLELAPTPEFPQGSATRAYLLSLPLRRDGTVDEKSVQANPQMARFKRFWPSEPDRAGLVVRQAHSWTLSFKSAREGGPAVFPIAMDRLLPGDEATIAKPDGGRWPFRVVRLEEG